MADQDPRHAGVELDPAVGNRVPKGPGSTRPDSCELAATVLTGPNGPTVIDPDKTMLVPVDTNIRRIENQDSNHTEQQIPATHSPQQYETLAGQGQSLTLHPETQPMRNDRDRGSEKSEQEAFIKSIEARIDPQESPTLLVSDPDLIKCDNIRVGKHSCPMLDQIALIKKLGEGGNGAVFLGYQRLFGDVAVKTLKMAIVQYDPGMTSRFFLEARLSKKLSSPYVVKTYDARKDGQLNFLVMEYINGIDAGKYKTQCGRAGAAAVVPERHAIRICIAATKGLKVLHDAGVMHRDIKPQNIMIPYDKKTGELLYDSAKLMDLGLAKTDDNQAQSIVRQEEDKTIQGSLLGTPGFMSPEQVLDCSSVGPQSDIFSIGATLYCLLVGVPPFRELMGPQATASATVHGNHVPVTTHCVKSKIKLSRGIITIVEQCLRKKPEERYNTADELLDDLKRVLEGNEPIAKRRRAPMTRTQKWLAAFGAAAMLVLAFATYRMIVGPEVSEHEKLIRQATDFATKQEFAEAQKSINKAQVLRLTSKQENDLTLIKRENEATTLIQTEREKLKTRLDKGLAAFHKFVESEEFDKAATQLNELRKDERHLEEKDKIPVLQGELETGQKKRQERFKSALNSVESALQAADFAVADKFIEVARAIEPANPNVLKFTKDIQRGKAQAAIEDILKNNGDLAVALAKLDEIKKIEPGHASIEELAGKITREDEHRKLLGSIDRELDSLHAGTGDLGNVTPLIEKLSATDPTRKPREEKANASRAEFDKLAANIRAHLADSTDLVVAAEALKAAEKIWRSNPDLPGLTKKLESANAAYTALIGEIKTAVVPDLASAESKVAKARTMKPGDALVKECDGLIAAEKAFRVRLDAMETSVAKVDKEENFDAVKKVIDDCAAYRKEEKRVEAALAQYDTKHKAYKEKILVAAMGKLQSSLQELGAYGDGGTYSAWEQHLNEVLATAPTDPRLAELRSAYQKKWDIEEAKSVVGHVRRLKKSEADYSAGKLGIKELEAQLANSESTFPKETAFAKQRELVDKVKTDLKQKMAQVSEMIEKKQNLDSAEALWKDVTTAYPDFDGTAKAQKDLAAQKTFFTSEVKAIGEKLAAGKDLESLDERIGKTSQMYPRDPEVETLKRKMGEWIDNFAKSLDTIGKDAASGNIESGKSELDKVKSLFPSNPQLPKLATQLKDAQEGVLKELVDVDNLLTKNAFEKGSFVKASEDMARFLTRLPSDKEIARVEEKRLKIVKDAEALIPDVDKSLAGLATVDILLKAQTSLDRIQQIVPKNAKVAALLNQYKLAKSDYDRRQAAAAESARQEVERQKAANKAVKPEDPSGF